MRGHDGAPLSGPRGPARQEERRTLEHDVRQEVVGFTTWVRTLYGWSLGAAADLLGLAARTVRHWCQTLSHGPQRCALLGRPTRRASLAVRQELCEVLEEVGPGIGVPTLRELFPEMGRAELEDFVRRYRRVWRWQHRQPVQVLRWTTPGRVWAMDFTYAPCADPQKGTVPLTAPGTVPFCGSGIDGIYPYLLAVRDLASGQQLLALPTLDMKEETVRPILASLFATCGAPLVLKMDNGSAFRAGACQEYLRQYGVTSLFSPPRMPRYNGSIEAGIGSLKKRIEIQATLRGRPGSWTWDDVEAARLEANATSRPRGLNEPTPDEAWTARSTVGDLERRSFQARVSSYRAAELAGLTGTDPAAVTGTDWDLLWSQKELAGEDRSAVRRALEASGYLLYPRRRIHLPIPGKKTARDS